MTAYEELLEFGGERIFDFLKNARLHESQFKYSEFNEVCYKKMYIENNQDSIKTVKELKEEMETKILQHWFILRYITKRASRDSVNTLLVDLMLMVVKEKKIQII